MNYLAALGGLTTVGLALAVWALRVRMDGLRGNLRAAYSERNAAEAALKIGTKEFDDYRMRAEAMQAKLVSELERYENEELDAIESEPDRPRRIERRRNWVRSVLSKASPPTGDDSEDGVREESSSDSPGG